VNPQHLETHNTKGVSHIAHAKHRGANQRKTHCIRGHALEGTNLIIRGTRRRAQMQDVRTGAPLGKAASKRTRATPRRNSGSPRGRMQQQPLAS